MHPATVPAERLRGWAGNYGIRTILFEDGGLVWLRANGQKVKLTAMTSDGLFAAEGYDERLRMRFTADALEIHRVDEPAPTRFPRN